MNDDEKWMDVPGFTNIYWISDQGRVKHSTFIRDIILPVKKVKGKMAVKLFRTGYEWWYAVDDILACAMGENKKLIPLCNDNPSYYEHTVGCEGKPKFRRVRCIETGVVYRCAKDAARDVGLGASIISRRLQGQMNTKNSKRPESKYHWEYVPDDEYVENVRTVLVKQKKE